MLRRLRPTSLGALLGLGVVSFFSACSSSDGDPPPNPDTGPPELCQEPNPANEIVRITPSDIVVAPGESRTVRVFIEPDVCTKTPIPLQVANAGVAKIDGTFDADLKVAEARVKITGVAAGTTTVTATFGPSKATVNVDVRPKDMPSCTGKPAVDSDAVPGKAVAGLGASLLVPAGAQTGGPTPPPPPGMVTPYIDTFRANVACGTSINPPGTLALGPAITFGPVEKRFLREIAFEVPVNPAIMPTTANLRHVRVVYASTSLKTARIVPVTNGRFEKKGSDWVYAFDAPRLGTYQVVVAQDAGTKTRKRKLNHRAVFGFSMGGIGASMFGMNHHDMFDVVAPLGGPLDANWFLWYFQNYHFGGFCPRKAGDPIPTTPCVVDPGAPTEMFEHVQSFENWWHYPDIDGAKVGGTGGTFPRSEYIEIFRDVSAMWGDPASENTKFPWVASGIDKPLGFRVSTGDYCDDPAKSTVAKTGYYDKTFNPDGKLPVIRYCDGASAPGLPCKWVPGGTQPVEVTLAVDLNGNGKRDEGEPVITQPSEPFSDVGTDKLASKDEPGYDAVTNPDPAGDDYDFQYNPTGTEGNHHYDEGEPYEDLGIDGVVCPDGPGKCPFDVGEGDGKYTMSSGLRTFLDRDGRSQLLGWAPAPPGGKWDQAALDNFDFYSDGGIRDIFNWAVVGNHYTGGFTARGRPVAFYDDWGHLPNAPLANSDLFDPKNVDFEALPQTVYLRYGNVDASSKQIKNGDGQHVGYADQVFRRIQTGLYYIGSRWPDADRRYFENPPDVDTPGVPCGGTLTCTYDFKDTKGRSGPTTVILPAGYHSPDAKDLRYPVVYFLHGYGQTPEDLSALVLLVTPFMGNGLSSRATRLAKMIMVIVDGRCRGEGDAAECVNGTFYTNSTRPGGPQIDNYFLDLMKHVDSKYRTLGPSEIDVTD